MTVWNHVLMTLTIIILVALTLPKHRCQIIHILLQQKVQMLVLFHTMREVCP